MADDRKPELALITGASSGYDLMIAAEEGAIQTVADQLLVDGANVDAVQVDLANANGVEELHRTVTATGRPLAVAALNAGIGAGGAFATDTELEHELEIVDLNVRSTVHLAKLVLRDMIACNQAGCCSPPLWPRSPVRSRPSTTRRSHSRSPSHWRSAMN